MSSLRAGKGLEKGGTLRAWDLKKEVVAQGCCLAGEWETLPAPAFLQEEVESPECHFDLPSGCEESLSNPNVSVWVTAEGWEGQMMLQRDAQS